MLNHIFPPELKMEIEQAAGNKTTEHTERCPGFPIQSVRHFMLVRDDGHLERPLQS